MTNRSDYYQFETIDRYLKGEMTEPEHKDFELAIENDPQLKHEVDLASAFRVGIENLQTKDLREDLKETNQVLWQIRNKTAIEPDKNDKNRNSNKRRLIRNFFAGNRLGKMVGAATILIVLIGGLYFFNNQQPNEQALFQEYYEAPPNLMALDTRSSSEKKSDMEAVMAPYEKGSYKKAITKANAYLEKHPNQQKIRFYRGIIHLELSNNQKAIQDLRFTKKHVEQYENAATWYLALIYLRDKDNREKSFKKLKQLKASPSRYQDKAKALLNETE